MSGIETESLDFTADDRLAGFRLQRLEVLNWGTFGNRVWSLEPKGHNALLTGDIGSGKSTLVDAVTALLVPAHRVAFNKAAGAETRERTLRSYVWGFYKSERNELSGSAKPVALRDSNSYSVILGVFHNLGYQQKVTLAQVFWTKDVQGPPARLFVAYDGEMSIASDFARFGSDMVNLRKRLKAAGADVHDAFPPYGAWFRRRFGIHNEQALELFHQTVSMKSVGNLTDFVRSHMLEPFDVESRIKALIEHFDNLNRAHEAVVKAKRQIELLAPIVTDCDRLVELAAAIEGLRKCREALKPYFADIKLELLSKRIATLAEEYARHDAHVERWEERKRELQDQSRDLNRSIAENGGDRIDRIRAEIEQNEEEKARRQRKAERYAELVRALTLHPAQECDAFLDQQREFAALREAASEREATLQNEQSELGVELAQRKQERDELVSELQSLRARISNIGRDQISIRDALCASLGYEPDDLPFAGELIQVRDDARDWEGAIERLMHSFGLSLLVPDTHYAKVAQWLDKTYLEKRRLVYLRVRAKDRADIPSLHPDSLVYKLAVKPESPLRGWLEGIVAQRFNLACCPTQEQFQREARAITRSGQVKTSVVQHEKDDRYRIDDRSRYVLGWSNASKIAALEEKARTFEAQIEGIIGRIGTIQKELTLLKRRLDTLSKLEEYGEYREVDWHPLAAKIAALEEERQRLESASDVLKTLTEKLKEVEESLRDVERQLVAQRDKRSKAEQRKSDAEEQARQIKSARNPSDVGFLAEQVTQLEAARNECLGGHQLTVESCDNREQEMRQWMQSRIDAEDKKLARLREKIIQAMQVFNTAFPLDTQEFDVAVESSGEYRAMLERLNSDDLPRFEERFKQLLNENAIREIANFRSQLDRERETIRERIDRINKSLTKIDYNPGRYIRVEAQAVQDVDIRDFQGELRKCTEGALSGSDDSQYSETKFLQVKAIIERFRGREGQTDADRRWTGKVTDVRNWFEFAASERWREDDKPHEHYSDSGGKSGGQKEKLAYTVLAASLAYQFGLEWGEVRSRTLRFVVIDEAFGRGSDESAQYALNLFGQLNLQLLIVTPLQKIHVIEPFVSLVGFVQNDDGRDSKLRNLTIEEYRAEKAKEPV